MSDTVSPRYPFEQPQPDWNILPCGSAPAVPYDDGADWRAIHTRAVVHPTAWIAPGAVVYGRVRLQARSSIWYGCVIRGDHEWIDVGEESNVQDLSILHVDPGFPCLLGNRVTLGHRATVHASRVEDDVLIGIGATVLSRCVIGQGALIAAGALVLEGTQVPAGTLWAGCPARQIKTLSVEQQERMRRTARYYVNNAILHRAAQAEGQADV